MVADNMGESGTPQRIIRGVVDLCADCDTCRTLMDLECVFFPELYRLWDREKETGIAMNDGQLRGLVELCTLCGLCPCPRVPADIMKAKSLYVKSEGLPPAVRLLTDVPRLARICGSFPRLVNAMQKSSLGGALLRKACRLHPERQLPEFPKESFFRWAARQGLTGRKKGARQVAYFAGCTAGYLFPQVGRAVVEVLQRNGVAVYVPQQQCCGMPHLVEGEIDAALQRTRYNMDSLLLAIEAGDDVVCSCPTCGYYLRTLLKERAHYSEAYQQSVHAGEDEIVVPNPSQGVGKFRVLRKATYQRILKDDGCFSSLPAMRRLRLSEQVFDAGEYLARLHVEGRFNGGLAAVNRRMVYFAPCHQRELQIGRPYLELMAQIPGLAVEPVGGESCCGMGGNFGMKARFHDKSLAVGQGLFAKIEGEAPEAIVTDCMSCRLQFRHALPYPVFHPMEVLADAYG